MNSKGVSAKCGLNLNVEVNNDYHYLWLAFYSTSALCATTLSLPDVLFKTTLGEFVGRALTI